MYLLLQAAAAKERAKVAKHKTCREKQASQMLIAASQIDVLGKLEEVQLEIYRLVVSDKAQ